MKKKRDTAKIWLPALVIVFVGLFSVAIYIICKYIPTNVGPLGDAFNGLLAPFIAILSAALLYYSFQQQIAANKLQYDSNKILQSQWQFDTFYRMYNEIDQKYKAIELLERRTNHLGEKIERRHYAAGWIQYLIDNSEDPYAFDDGDGNADYSILTPICFLINDICQYIKFVKESDIPQREFFLDRINDYYAHNMEKELMVLYDLIKSRATDGTYFTTCYERLSQNMEWLRSRGEFPNNYELE